MKYTLTLITADGLAIEETLNLPVEDTITWADFVNLKSVKQLLLLHPHMTLIDVTPEGMPDSFTDAEQQSRQLANMGLRKTHTMGHAPEYEDVE